MVLPVLVPVGMGVVVGVVMSVIMVVVVVVVVVVAMLAMLMGMLGPGVLQQPIRLLGCQQLRRRHLLFAGVGLGHDQVDHLVLEDWRAQLDEGVGVLLIVVVHDPLLAGITPSLLHQRGAHFNLGHAQFVAFPDFADHQAQAHAPLGDLAVLGAHFFF